MRRTMFGLILAWVALGVAGSAAAQEDGRAPETGWLGVQLGGAAGAQLEGVGVLQIIENGPAHLSGLRARDRIVSLDGVSVSSNVELIRLVQAHAPGSWVPLTVVRGDRELDLRVRLGTRPAELGGLRPLRGWIGVDAIGLPAALRERFGAPADRGVMVADVARGSSAEAAGFELGDVVFEIDGEPIVSPAELHRKLAGAGVGNSVVFRVARDGQEVELEAVVEAAPDPEAGR